MRYTLFSSLVVALLAAFAMAVAPQRAVIISWPNETPDWVVEDAKEAIRRAKGVVCILPVLPLAFTLRFFEKREWSLYSEDPGLQLNCVGQG